MTKFIAEAALDAAFDYIATRADRLVLCAGAPATFTEANTAPAEGGKAVGARAIASGLGNGDFAVVAGPVSGRRLVLATQPEIAIGATASADHAALVDSGGELLSVTALTEPQAVTAGSVVTLRSFGHDLEQPV